MRLLREAGRVLGEALADVVSLLNPDVLVIGGNLAEVQEPLLPAIREAIYGRCPALTTRDLRIAPSQLASRAGTVGAALLAHEHVFDAERVSAELGL
jgi:predicted NBD/HSP70 family sugar kinase